MRHSRRTLALFGFYLALAGAGCALFDLGEEPSVPVSLFNHVVHKEEEDMACTDCHTKAKKEDQAGMPKYKKCMMCHEDEEDKPVEKRLVTLFGKDPTWRIRTVLPDEVIFSHKAHTVQAKIACETCHGTIGKSTMIAEVVQLTMTDCMACHAEGKPVAAAAPAGDTTPPIVPRNLNAKRVAADSKAIRISWTASTDDVTSADAIRYLVYGSSVSPVSTAGEPLATETGKNACTIPEPPEGLAYFRVVAQDAAGNRSDKPTAAAASPGRFASNDCSVCHRELGRETPPASHGRAWRQLHGAAARAKTVPPYANQCSLCHTEATCSSCHQQEAPTNHTAFWRERGHGVAVGIDRSACYTCHRTDTCDRCHLDTAPRSHVGSWGTSRQRHCYSCHLGAGRDQQSCSLCHRRIIHNGPPRPSDPQHAGVPESQCRSCHSIIDMQHADNGDACVGCH